jgi:pimeloyl-ACP methyl ester carboxylesterase
MWRGRNPAPILLRMTGRTRARLFALSLSVVLAGCESIIAAEAARDHPVEGQLVEVEPGRRLHIDCRGEGSPTVVLHAGGDTLGALAWAPVHDRLAQKSRTCAYSRAGILWSDPASGAFEPEEVAHDLHAALKAAGEKPPYVMAGHSRGGLYAMIYAGLYREEIAGLVLADSSHPDQETKFAEAGVATGPYVSPWQEMALALRWTGVMRLGAYPADPMIADRADAYFPKSAAANAREARHRRDILETAGRFRDLQNWPVVVLAREPPELTQRRRIEDAHNAYLLSADGLVSGASVPDAEVVWRRLQADMATWSSRGRLQIVPDSNHAFFFYRPEVIVSAVSEVLAAARVVRRPPQPAG